MNPKFSLQQRVAFPATRCFCFNGKEIDALFLGNYFHLVGKGGVFDPPIIVQQTSLTTLMPDQ